MTIKEKSYKLYKFNWLSSHGYTLDDVLKKAWTIINHVGFDIDIIDVESDLLDAFEEVGFNGEIYACFDEFIDSEYQDRQYMECLLGGTESDDYKAYIKDIEEG